MTSDEERRVRAIDALMKAFDDKKDATGTPKQQRRARFAAGFDAAQAVMKEQA